MAGRITKGSQAAHERALKAAATRKRNKASAARPATAPPKPRVVAVGKLTDGALKAEYKRTGIMTTEPAIKRRYNAVVKELKRRGYSTGTETVTKLRSAPVTKKLPGRAAKLRAEFEQAVLSSHARRENGSGFSKIRDVRADVMARLHINKDTFTRELNSMRDRNDKNKSGRYELHYEMNEDDWRNFTGKPPSYSHIWHGHQYDFLSIIRKRR